jgi:Domain of unknown function (DUF3883)
VPLDYAAIKRENVQRFGTDIDRIGRILLADRYDDRTHFIFELLQNAEDALSRRGSSQGRRSVSFRLSQSELSVSHFGIPFDEDDVRGICGIAQSTKDINAIGRFGIGFKSVYAFTDSPEIHSGDEHFAIDSFVWPRSVPAIGLTPGETVMLLGLRQDDPTGHDEIATALRRLGPRVLLFLREIEEIGWALDDGSSGFYLRSARHQLSANAHRIQLVGEERDVGETEESWLVVSREVSREGTAVGRVELAFSLQPPDDWPAAVRPIDDSALVVFFPTIVPTNLGFLAQGPYRTTPSRDNVPRQDPWNQYLVRETAELLIEAMRSMRDLGLLNAAALQCLPIDRAKFAENTMFAPLFDAVSAAFTNERLLPCLGGDYAEADATRLARTQELRQALNPSQLTSALESTTDLAWLTDEITQDRTPALRTYLMRELSIPELTWETILPRLTKAFLEAQTNDWIVSLYEVLGGQPALLRTGKLEALSLVRLEGGKHVPAFKEGQPQAFLPGSSPTDFPTVSSAVAGNPQARAFLEQIGLTEPDPVDDILRNVLPGYASDGAPIPPSYSSDIQRIVNAFSTDSKSRREALIEGLRNTPFVAVVDRGTGAKMLACPTDVYVATQRLRELFEGVSGVLLVDDSEAVLRGEPVRDLLEACGASRYLQPVPSPNRFTWEDMAEMRRLAGWTNSTGGDAVHDFAIRGLAELLDLLETLPPDSAATRSFALWEALRDVDDRRGHRAFYGTYQWFYFSWRGQDFDAAFVDLLNARSWVPDGDGQLQPPHAVVFDLIAPAWKPNSTLLSKIRFKPPALEALAREAGIEPGILDLLKRLGVTSEADLRSRLGIDDETATSSQPEGTATAASDSESERDRSPIDATAHARDTGIEAESSSPAKSEELTGVTAQAAAAVPSAPTSENDRGAQGESRVFVSYIAVRDADDEPDPDGIDQKRRLELEERAIQIIVDREPNLRRTSANNPGFDLVEQDEAGQPIRWVEVKAMASSLKSRPVGMSRTQFLAAQDYGNQYWLYIVENAGSDPANVIRIEDPAGKARTFTFDHGWIRVASTAPED